MTDTKQLLPIGTIVRLANSDGLVMIAGFLPEGASHPGEIWDYSGFLFPIGIQDAEEVFLFDNNQIEEIYALGYQDAEAFEFLAGIADLKTRLEEEAQGGNQGEAPDQEGEDDNV